MYPASGLSEGNEPDFHMFGTLPMPKARSTSSKSLERTCVYAKGVCTL